MSGSNSDRQTASFQERTTGEVTLANLEREKQTLIQQRLETNKLLGRDRALLHKQRYSVFLTNER